jgi:hypothetical protein
MWVRLALERAVGDRPSQGYVIKGCLRLNDRRSKDWRAYEKLPPIIILLLNNSAIPLLSAYRMFDDSSVWRQAQVNLTLRSWEDFSIYVSRSISAKFLTHFLKSRFDRRVRHGCRLLYKKMQTWKFAFFYTLQRTTDGSVLPPTL